MSAQLRYRTLTRNIGQIYASPKEGRTNLLQSGLDEIVTVINPNSTSAWNVVGADSERLLKVWVAKEADPAAEEVANQLTDLLWELSLEDKEPSAAPALQLNELPRYTSLAAAAESLSDQIKHITLSDDEESEVEVEVAETASHQTSEVEVEVEVEMEVEEEAPPTPKPAEVVKPIAAPIKPVEVAKPVAAPIKPVAAPTKPVLIPEPEPEPEEEEVVEEEEEEEMEEEEEGGMEVERIFIRGRPYWLETNTQKLYAIEGEDDVGDEVGEMVAGKPRFYAK